MNPTINSSNTARRRTGITSSVQCEFHKWKFLAVKIITCMHAWLLFIALLIFISLHQSSYIKKSIFLLSLIRTALQEKNSLFERKRFFFFQTDSLTWIDAIFSREISFAQSLYGWFYVKITCNENGGTEKLLTNTHTRGALTLISIKKNCHWNYRVINIICVKWILIQCS